MKPLEYSKFSFSYKPEITISPPDVDGEVSVETNCCDGISEAFIPFSILKEWVLSCEDKNQFEKLLSTEQAAEQAGLSTRRIQQLAPALINAGLAARIGKAIVIHTDAISWIKTLPETRGRKKTA